MLKRAEEKNFLTSSKKDIFSKSCTIGTAFATKSRGGNLNEIFY